MVCERFLENKVHAAQSAAGREASLRPAGGLGGRSLEPGPTLVDMVTTGFGPGGQ